MKGVSELIKAHGVALEEEPFDEAFTAYHLTQIRFLQHERLAHLLVMLFVFLAVLIVLALLVTQKSIAFLLLFILLLALAIGYVIHYYKLENTVIKWYFIYNDHWKNLSNENEISRV